MATGAVETRYVQSVMAEMGHDVSIRMHTDSSSAKQAAEKHGVGRLKHVQLRNLFVKDMVKSGVLVLIKEATQANFADVLTKPVSGQRLRECLAMIPAVRLGSWQE